MKDSVVERIRKRIMNALRNQLSHGEPVAQLAGPTLRVLTLLSRKCYFCNYISRRLDFQVFSDKTINRRTRLTDTGVAAVLCEWVSEGDIPRMGLRCKSCREMIPSSQTKKSFTKQDKSAKTSTTEPNIQYYLLLPFKRLEKNGPWKWSKKRTAPDDIEFLSEKEKRGEKNLFNEAYNLWIF